MDQTFDNTLHAAAEDANFSGREVGITHPDVPGFLRIKDNGDIEVVAGEGLAIVMSPKNGSITFVADSVNFMTRPDGFKWNHVAFNDRATTFTEPTFIFKEPKLNAYDIHEGIEFFSGQIIEDTKRVAVRDSEGNEISFDEYVKQYPEGETLNIEVPDESFGC